MSTKAALKAVGAAIQGQKYDEAVEQAKRLLTGDPQNYQGNIFLGFALDKQNKPQDAEQAYIAATKSKSNEPQAWQGLIKLYEKQGDAALERYQDAALRLAEIYRDIDDKYKCQDVIDKFVDFAKKEGSRLQYRQALEVHLPSSPVYGFLEGRIPHPGHTYQTIAQLTEAEEKERINKEIGERRTRLGARIDQVTTEVKREVICNSPLEDLYEAIIDWSNDDEVRRQYEEKLLKRCYDTLIILPPSDLKSEKRSKVWKLANDMVIIKHPYQLAWDISIEWQDHKLVQEWDPIVLREYAGFFNDRTGLGGILKAFMSSEISPFPAPPPPPPNPAQDAMSSDEDDDEGGGVGLDGPLTAQDRILMMTEGMSEVPTSIFAHRLVGEYFAYLDEHEAVVELMRKGVKAVAKKAASTGITFQNGSEAITAMLATSLVFYQSPRNHPEAKGLFDTILSHNPTSTPALIGIGLIYEEEEDYPAAIDFLDRAMERDKTNIRVRAEAAWVRALNGDYEHSKDALEDCLSSMEGSDSRSRELRAQTLYRIGVCIWNIDTSKSARKDRTGAYARFLAALKANLNFAPAYTSLGIYYADYSKDKKRARKCFQKAFELSPSEVEAAERLARAFAQQGEWDLVEVVAQRVVDSGKVRPAPGSKKKGFSWPFAALGVAELNKQDYTKSVVSFQSALRITPNDYHSWVGLGESYHNSGRYVAATKAFQHAEKFEGEAEHQEAGSTWFAKYMLSNVKRELGNYEEAINGYREVLETRSNEYGVSIALIQTLVDSAWDSVDKALFGQSAALAHEAITVARNLATIHPNAFNLWKSVGDACSVFSWVQSRTSEFPAEDLKQLLQIDESRAAYDLFADVDGVGTDVVFSEGLFSKEEEDGVELTRCMHAAILAHKRAIYASADDIHAQAVAYFNLGWTEHRAHVALSPSLKKRTTRYTKAAVRCFKRAIELEAGNSEFWNALGVVTSELNPKVAQHSFVRSLYLNERSAQTWTNLGTLYLLQNDHQLANEAFTRAQSTDPDFAHAWLGQGIIALLLGDPKEAKLLFTHAVEISESSSLLTKRQYALATFDHIVSSSTGLSIVDLVQPLFALNQLNALAPHDLPYQHLSTLLSERIDDMTTAITALESICAKVEADYEVSESPMALSQFALGKADLARCYLASHQYADAIESAELSIQLSDEDAGNELSADARRKCRLSAHLTMGLAQYYNKENNKAIEYFEAALEESKHNPDTVCLLAQVLWAQGTEASRSKARDHLFDTVESTPGHVQSVLLLGIIALLDNDLESLEAVTEDLQALRTSKSITDDEQSRLGEVLRAIAALSTSDADAQVLKEIQTDVMLHPNHPYGWGRLADVDDDEFAAEMALKTALKAVPPRGQLDAADLANAHAGTGKVADAQRAIALAPWLGSGWAALGTAVEG